MLSGSWISRSGFSVCLTAMLVANAGGLLAMARQKGTAPASASSAGKQGAPATAARQPAAAANSADAQAKAEIMNSPRWKSVVHTFNEWLSAQNIYSKDQVPRVKAQFNQMVRTMNAAQLQAWLDEMEEKLNILMSPEAEKAREWLGHFVSAKVVIPERELKKFDILHMTTEQMRATIDNIEERKASLKSEAQAFNVTREEEVRDAVREAEQQQAQQAQGTSFTNRSMQSYFPGYQSQYAPRRQYSSLYRGPQYYVSPWGGVGMLLP